jgi:hypothetical protein
MSYEIQLDEFACSNACRGSSTVKIAEESGRSIHWGNASHHGETRPIVTVKIGFLSITVDEAIFGANGKKKLSALHHRYVFQIIDEEQEQRRLADTTPANRFDAATAAVTAGDYELACNIESSVLDMIVLTAVQALAKNATVEHIAGILREASYESTRIYRRGFDAAKTELRTWLQT